MGEILPLGARLGRQWKVTTPNWVKSYMRLEKRMRLPSKDLQEEEGLSSHTPTALQLGRGRRGCRAVGEILPLGALLRNTLGGESPETMEATWIHAALVKDGIPALMA